MASNVYSIVSILTGLGKEIEFIQSSTVTTTPTASAYMYRTQVEADTAEALDLGDVAVEHLLIIKAVTHDLEVDLDWVDDFDKDFTIPEGEWACIPQPAGTVYVKGETGEAAVYEYIIIGET